MMERPAARGSPVVAALTIGATAITGRRHLQGVAAERSVAIGSAAASRRRWEQRLVAFDLRWPPRRGDGSVPSPAV